MTGSTIGVFAAAFNEQDRILCVHQAYGPKRWTTPGGRLEEGEDPRVGVLRELHEETGYHGEVEAFLGTYLALYKKPMDSVLWFKIRLLGRDPWQPNDEIQACAFFAEDQLPEPMAFNTRTRIEDAFNAMQPALKVFDTENSVIQTYI